MGRTALIFGATGQDGYYLTELLLSKGYRTIGTSIGGLPASGFLKCDVADARQVGDAVQQAMPDEIYNLAGVSSPAACESNPALAHAVNAGGAENILAAVRRHAPAARLFQASTAYIFQSGPEPKNEESPCAPSGVYGKTKLAAHRAVVKAREEQGLFAANGILFNHESPLRPLEFVTRKVTNAAAQFKLGVRSEPLPMGNLDAVRDWGFAEDYVQAMWLMLQAGRPGDYVIATGVGHTVRDLCRTAFSSVGLDYEKCIAESRELVRRNEVDCLVGDPGKIRRDLKWSADTSFEKLVGMMVEADLRQVHA